MANENEVLETTADDVTGVDYIAEINNLKASTVSKSEYAKVVEENKKLVKSLIDGGQVTSVAPEKNVDIDALRKELFSAENNLTNLDFCDKALKLRDALIEKGERDPFLPYGKDVLPTDEDVHSAERVAAVLKECVDYAAGDANIFTDELQRRLVDSAPIRRRK